MDKPRIEVKLYLNNDMVISSAVLPDEYTLRECMQQLDIAPLDAHLFDKMICTPAHIINKIQKDREQFAKYLSKQLTDHIINLMQDNDLFLGYKLEALNKGDSDEN